MRGRYAGRSPEEIGDAKAQLDGIRDRVLAGAAVKPGDTVLDVGAGTGLLTFGARELVGNTGQVIGLDVSVDLLYELLAAAHESGTAGIALQLGAAEVIPLPDAAVDVVMTRSVLIYVRDKSEAAREFFRVLRPGGRISLFEPVNRRAASLSSVVDLAELAPQMDEWHARRLAADDPMVDFDVGDLERMFAEAGFAAVREDVVADVLEMPADALLTTPPAPGKQPILAEWRERYGAESAERLVELVHAHGARVDLDLTLVYVSARKP